MISSEFIIEDLDNTESEDLLFEGIEVGIVIGYNDVVFHVTDHYYDRLRYRKYHKFIHKDFAEPFLKKCGQARKKMAKILPKTQFYVWDHESDISFGMRKLPNDRDGTQHIWVGTAITPQKDGGPTMTYDSDVEIIHMA